MEIIIPIPQYSADKTDYKSIQGYLKQIELAIHHAQKAVENAEQSNVEITENSYVIFENSSLQSSLNIETKGEKDEAVRKYIENFVDNHYEEIQQVELKINIQ